MLADTLDNSIKSYHSKGVHSDCALLHKRPKHEAISKPRRIFGVKRYTVRGYWYRVVRCPACGRRHHEAAVRPACQRHVRHHQDQARRSAPPPEAPGGYQGNAVPEQRGAPCQRPLEVPLHTVLPDDDRQVRVHCVLCSMFVCFCLLEAAVNPLTPIILGSRPEFSYRGILGFHMLWRNCWFPRLHTPVSGVLRLFEGNVKK